MSDSLNRGDRGDLREIREGVVCQLGQSRVLHTRGESYPHPEGGVRQAGP